MSAPAIHREEGIPQGVWMLGFVSMLMDQAHCLVQSSPLSESVSWLVSARMLAQWWRTHRPLGCAVSRLELSISSQVSWPWREFDGGIALGRIRASGHLLHECGG